MPITVSLENRNGFSFREVSPAFSLISCFVNAIISLRNC